jgi:hypothetical protein
MTLVNCILKTNLEFKNKDFKFDSSLTISRYQYVIIKKVDYKPLYSNRNKITY